MLAAHPYEEPAYDVVELADPGTITTGTGRVGTCAAATLGVRAGGGRRAARRRGTASAWRATPTGSSGRSRSAAEPVTSCSTMSPASDVDVYVTSDLRHHPAAEFVEKGGPALIDVAHWAAESTWLPVVAARLAEALGNGGHPGEHALHRPLDTVPMRERAL